MKQVVLVLPKPPFPVRDGGQKALAASVELWAAMEVALTIVVLHTPKHPWNAEAIPKGQPSHLRWMPLFVDTSVKIQHVWLALSKGLGLRAARFYSKEVEETLASLCKQADLVVFESPFTALYALGSDKWAPVYWYRAHNVEYKIWGGRGFSMTSWIMKLDNLFLKGLEHRIWKKMDKILAITPEDQEVMIQAGTSAKVEVFPVHMHPPERPLMSMNRPLQFFHLGAMDWLPTREGIGWFVKEVWPNLHALYPQSQLHLGGRHFPPHTGWEKINGVVVHGEVADIDSFLEKGDVLVVPLFQGGGIRIKILEALAAGKAVVASSKALEGLAPEVKAVCLATDHTPESWTTAVTLLCQQKTHPEVLQNVVLASYGWPALRSQLTQWLNDTFY